MASRSHPQPGSDLAAFASRLARLSGPVSAFWGIGMRVVPGLVNAFDWNTVIIDQDEQDAPDDALTVLLLHEWGHRTLAPITIAQGFWWEILARLEGISASAEAANLAADLLVDAWYLAHPSWGALYAREERCTVEQLLDRAEAASLDPVLGLFLSCYARLARWSDLEARLGSDPQLVTRAVRALFDEAVALDARVRSFFRLLAPVFRQRGSDPRWADRSMGRQAGGPEAPMTALRGSACPWRGPRWDARALVRLLVSSGDRLPEKVLEDVLGRTFARQIKGRRLLLDSLLRVEPKVQRLVRDLRTERPDGATLWQPGEALRQLETVSSLERFGRLLPGVTTLKRRYVCSQERHPGLDHVILVVDNSGSTSGQIIQSELDAAVALVEACRHLRAQVSLIVFGSEVVASIEPGHEYDRVEILLVSLEGQSGGTCLAPALQRAIHHASLSPGTVATVLFTDTYVHDTRQCLPSLSRLRERGPLVLFLVEHVLDQEFVQAVGRLPKPPRLVRHRPGAPLVDQALGVLTG
jgi:hypothetical protein